MRIIIDSICMDVESEKSLLDLIRCAGMDSQLLSERPLAAQIAGEIFTLNYIPFKNDGANLDRLSLRRAVKASGGIVKLLRYADRAGEETYCRTMSFVIGLAFHRLWPESELSVSCTIGRSLYYRVDCCEHFSAAELKKEVAALIEEDISLKRRRRDTDTARESYLRESRPDKAELLRWRKQDTYDDYCYDGYSDYFCGEMLPSSGYLTVWDLIPAEDGFFVLFPSEHDPDTVSEPPAGHLLFDVFAQGERWSSLMECHTVPDLNKMVMNGQIHSLIRVNEALHERRFSQIAEMICARQSRIVMLAGPSSSGKTTSANRLAVQLITSGKKTVLISLDDYYRNREDLEREAGNNQPDLEHINALDTALFREQIHELLTGNEVEIPSYDFSSGQRVWNGNRVQLGKDSVMIVEGLHALNPAMIPEELSDSVFKLYVSPLLSLNLDRTNRIPTSSLRLLRRIVRDHRTRGTSVRKTMEMWRSVQNGEKQWIFPFQEQADVFFNSSTLYELSVLKRVVYPLLEGIGPEEPCYEEVRSIVKILNYVTEADVEYEIPPTSIVREFVGGNTFYM